MYKLSLLVPAFLLAFKGAAMADLAFPLDAGQRQRFEGAVGPQASTVDITVGPVDRKTSGDRKWRVQLIPDKEGIALSAKAQTWSKESGWSEISKATLQFWPRPADKRNLDALASDQIPAQSWRERTLQGVVERKDGQLLISLEGRLLGQMEAASAAPLTVKIQGLTNEAIVGSPEASASSFTFVDLENLIRADAGAAGSPTITTVGGIPFELWETGKKTFSLAKAGWADWQRDPGNYLESYDAGPLFLGDLRQPFTQLPKADYSAAYVLAKNANMPDTTEHFTLRLGRRMPGPGEKGQVLIYDFPGDFSKSTASESNGLRIVKIPLTAAFSQDIEDGILDLEITKEIRLARRAPDPGRFRWRPLGLPSGLQIAGITLEKSPIQLRVTPLKTGALFPHAEPVQFRFELTNISSESQSFKVDISGVAATDGQWHGELPAGATSEKVVTLDATSPGFYRAAATISGTPGILLKRSLAFGILADLPQEHRDESPFGTWDFFGYHFTPSNGDTVGQLFQTMGLRYAKSKMPLEFRKKYGLRQAQEMSVRMSHLKEDNLERYRKFREETPDGPQGLMLFHEDSISGDHATRVPDLFSELPAYKLNEVEQKRFDEMFTLASQSAAKVRAEFPETTIHLGNGPLVIREELYRAKFPADLFDTAGNENASFGRPPEAQPPDTIANNSSLWMDRQMLDAYGYKDKAVSQCLETIYPGTNPGNLSYQTQADYFVRHVLHSLAWGMPFIRPGSITDIGNSYYYSNWGSSGFFTRRPNITPKPSAVAMATLIRVLDGAKYEGFVDTESDSTYLMKFRKKDGSLVMPYWAVRGKRPLNFTSSAKVENLSENGERTDLLNKEDRYSVTAKSSPQYLLLPPKTSVENVTAGAAIHQAAPQGKVTEIQALNRLSNWEVLSERNAELELYNPMTPRRKGDFTFKEVKEFEGRSDVLEISAKPLKSGKPTTPQYAELQAKVAVTLPGKPSELGLWINGNSGWGRIIFELRDASGQTWTSIGASSKGESAWMADWLGGTSSTEQTVKKRADWNTEDVFGLSRINFDGWRYVGFPLPGQYPGEGYHWPINSQWKWNKDGVVHYPLTLTKLIVELPEKVLHLTRFAPPRRGEIYLSGLVAVERDQDAAKSVPDDYTEETQVTID